MACALLIFIVLAYAFEQEITVLRIYTSDRRQQTERQLHPVLSLCANIPKEKDFLLSLSSPCLKAPSDILVFLISRKAVLLWNLELVKVPGPVLVRQSLYDNTQTWEITLPAHISLNDIDRIAIGVEADFLPCPARIPSELTTLQTLISTGTVWTCAFPPSCPFPCTSARSLDKNNDCQEHRNDYYSGGYEDGNCEPKVENVPSNSAAVAVVAVIIIFGWYWSYSICFCVVVCIVGFIICLKRRRSNIMNRVAHPVVVIPNQDQNYGAVRELEMWAFAVPFPSPNLLSPVLYSPSLSNFQETTCSICMQE